MTHRLSRGLAGSLLTLTGATLALLPAEVCFADSSTVRHSFIRLPADYVNMAPVTSYDGKSSKLIVFVRTSQNRSHPLHAETLVKDGPHLRRESGTDIPPHAAAFDICKGASSNQGENIIFLLPNGLQRLGEKKPFLETPVIFAHRQEDALPRIRVCFDLFPGEPPAYVVPRLDRLVLWRQKKTATFEPAGEIALEADLRHQSALLRGADLKSTQRIVFRLELPDVHLIDFNGDGLNDLCLTVKDRLRCRIQDALLGFQGPDKMGVEHRTHLLTGEEELDSNIRVDSKLIDLTGDKKPDFIVNKVNWNLANLGTKISIYPQGASGDFPKKPAQEIERRGFFAYQEYFDFDGDGFVDLVAPFAAIDWQALLQTYFSRNVDIDFVWYRNRAGKLDERPLVIHSLTYPVEFKNMPALLGALPQWGSQDADRNSSMHTQTARFFPQKNAIEWRSISWDPVKEKKDDVLLRRHEAPLGSDALTTDLDKDGLEEILFAYPRDPHRKNQLLFVLTGAPGAP